MRTINAGVAHPVERHLAKVEVASSSLVTRSRKKKDIRLDVLLFSGSEVCLTAREVCTASDVMLRIVKCLRT